MTERVRRLRALFVAAALATATTAAGPLGSAAAASGRCPAGTGVTVVVDFGRLGGGVPVACDPGGAGDSARAVSERTGFDLQDVRTQPGFVCAIDGRPNPDTSCQRTPPADAYWGLFWSDGKSGTWTYSTKGVDSLSVPEGGSIGWRWQDGGSQDRPGAAPNGPSPSPQPKPTSSPKPQPKPQPQPKTQPQPQSPGAGTASSTQGPAAGPGAPPSSAPRRKPGTPAATPTRGRTGKAQGRPDRHRRPARSTPTAEPSAAPSETTDALAPTSGEPAADPGSDALLTGVAALAVVCLGAAAGVIGWRRRRG
jgi:hypothetical protein